MFRKRFFRRWNKFILIAGLVFGGLFGSTVIAKESPNPDENISQNYTKETELYFPLLFRNQPLPPNEFGVEIIQTTVGKTIQKAVELNVTWVRYNGILWHEVEPQPGVIDWSKLTMAETEIEMISNAGLEPMVIVRGTPAWARIEKYPDIECVPIREDALDDFANFMFQIVSKYSTHPYYVKYWEIGNEPDVDPRWYPKGLPFGCWGDNDDLRYYGGQYYAEMLKHVYPAIKAADPDAKVIMGGLLLLCDPKDPPDGRDCREAKFIEGVLSNNGGDYFDILAYHSYPYWYEWMVNVEPDLTQFLWSHRGGIFSGKADYLREIMNEYGVNKPLMMNEGSLLCGWPDDLPEKNAACRDGNLYNAQAAYSVRMYVRTFALDIMGSAWYTLNGPNWRLSGLLTSSREPLPAYNAMKFMISLFKEAEYQGELSTGSLEGYEFYDPIKEKVYQVYWSNSDFVHTIEQPDKLIAVYDTFGNDITLDDVTIQVPFLPIYIELIP